MGELDILVVRKNGEVISFYGIYDSYTDVWVSIPLAGLDEATVSSLQKAYFYKTETSLNKGDIEVKDICGEYGCISIHIETVKINFQ